MRDRGPRHAAASRRPRRRHRKWLLLIAVSLMINGAVAAAAVGRVGDQIPTDSDAAPAAPVAPPCTPAPLDQRAAAVLIAGMPDTTRPDDPLVSQLPRLGVSGILLTARNVTSAAQVSALTSALRHNSRRPLLITADEEGGQVTTFDTAGISLPSARQQGTQSASSVESTARSVATRLRLLGVNSDLAPVADVDAGPAGGAIGDRSFSGDPRTASAAARAFATGLSDAGVTPVVKHFPGLGKAGTDTHLAMPYVRESVPDLMHDLQPFLDAIHQGAPAVMVSHAAYPALGDQEPASISPAVYKLLRSLGFQGVAMTDSLGMGAVNLRYDFPEAAVRALLAGADALLVTDGRQASRMRDAIVAAVRTGRLPESRLDEAAARTTALAGGDPRAMACQDVTLPRLH